MAEELAIRALWGCFLDPVRSSLWPLIMLSCGSWMGLPGALLLNAPP